LEVLAPLVRDEEMLGSLVTTMESFAAIAEEGHSRWVVTYSGGKDSTLLAILAAVFLERNPQIDVRLHVIYSDTLLEIPPLREAADALLAHMKERFRNSLRSARVSIVVPAIRDRFWVKLLGRGYPPPGPRFRWCTHRLKIKPSNDLITEEGNSSVAVLTGVRYAESQSRMGRLTAMCATGGECGQDYWYARGPKGSNRSYYAPIVHWRTCKVWDFLTFVAPELGWPTLGLFQLYGAQNLRFGCWTCTLVKRDKTMRELVSRPEMSHLKSLSEYRNLVDRVGRDKARRILRPDGKPGPMDLQTRKYLLAELLKLQRQSGRVLISVEEVTAIRQEWRRKSWRNGTGDPAGPKTNRLQRKRRGSSR